MTRAARPTCSILLCIGLFLAHLAASGELEEIIVTAQQREKPDSL